MLSVIKCSIIGSIGRRILSAGDQSLTLLYSQAMAEGQSIIIDCDFEEQMTESEIKSLCGQLQYCYASNIRATKPCHLSFTSLKVSSICTPCSCQQQQYCVVLLSVPVSLDRSTLTDQSQR